MKIQVNNSMLIGFSKKKAHYFCKKKKKTLKKRLILFSDSFKLVIASETKFGRYKFHQSSPKFNQ